MNPLVSVIMACYNEEQWLEPSIQSILDQTFTDFEFILIDDGSTDKTGSIIKRYRSLDQRIRLVENEYNEGLAVCLNKGIALATGKYVARMDADDIAHPDRLLKQVRFLNQNEQVDILGTAMNVIEKHSGKPKGCAVLPEFHDQIVKRIFHKPLVYHPTIMAKKSVFENFGSYRDDLSWGEDADLWYRIYDKVVFHNLTEPLLTYRKKSRLSYKVVIYNLRNKWLHLKQRNLVHKYLHVLLKDAFFLSVRMVKNY